MLAGAAAAYLERYGVRPGARAVVFTNNDTTDAVAAALRAAGHRDRGRRSTSRARRARWSGTGARRSTGRLASVAIARAGGRDATRVEARPAAGLRRLEPARRTSGARRAAGCASTSGSRRFVPDGGPRGASRSSARPPATALAATSSRSGRRRRPIRARTPGDPLRRPRSATRPSPTSAARSAPACARSSTSSATRRSAPAPTRARRRASNAIGVAAELLGVDSARARHDRPSARRTCRSRSRRSPAATAATLFDPVRVTPIHAWHVAHGAVFENVGQWKRPALLPAAAARSMDEAVLRECAAARERRRRDGRLDPRQDRRPGPGRRRASSTASTRTRSRHARGRHVPLRRDVPAPTGWSSTTASSSRLGEERFLCTTTTGNAAPVLDWMEEWLQTEWPELRVWLTSVTEQWATVAVVGPRLARRCSAALAPELDARHRGLPVHDGREARRRRDPGAGLPDQLLGRARLRGERRRPARARRCGRP